MLFIGYPKCTTCIKAYKFFQNEGYEVEYRDIVKDKPSEKEIKNYHKLSNKDIDSIFNYSGMVYRELKLKDKLPSMSLEEKYKLLASDGKLVKRPIIVTDEKVAFGFKEKDWNKH